MIYTAQIFSQTSDAAGFVHLTLARPHAFEYKPGQFIALRTTLDSPPVFLALASHPSEKDLFLLSRTRYLGKTVFITAAQGSGFECDFSDSQPFLLITHGSGISAIRPAILERHAHGFNSDTLLYGIQDAASKPALDILTPPYSEKKILAYSQAGDRIQTKLNTLDLTAFGAVILIGGKAFMDDTKQMLRARGFALERVYSNS